MKKAVSYLRVSSKGQIEGDGFPRQQRVIASYAKKHRIKLVQEYKDEGVSGSKPLAERPGLLELWSRIVTNGVTIVLVERSDRLARDLIESELILREFRSTGVQVITADTGTDLTAGDDDNPSAVLIRQMLAAVAMFDKNSTVLKLRAARERKRAKTGSCEGRKRFGEHPDYPEEKETLARMKALRRKPRTKPGKPQPRKRTTYAEVAKILNDENRTTRMGRPWTTSGVFQIMNRK